MREIFNRDVKLSVPCPKCGHKVQETIRRLEQNPILTCPACGTPNQIKADEFKADLKKSEDLIRNFGKRR